MKMLKTFMPILLLITVYACSAPKEKELTTETRDKIDGYLTNTMELHNIPGLALAVVQDNKVTYENYFGQASLENDSPVTESTLFRIFSATKLVTATGVFQLIEKGKLSLEDEVSKYLDHLPTEWQSVKIKNLLSHSSGLPDLIRHKSSLSDDELMAKLSEAPIEFETGSQFRYNQTNYWLLAQIIEKITGTPFGEYILKGQFDNTAQGVLFSSNSQIDIPNRATRYLYNGRTKELERATDNNGPRGHPGNGLNITLNRFVQWDQQLNNNKLLQPETKAQMWAPFNFTNQKDEFLHGWSPYHVNHLESYGFSGGNLAAFRKFPKSNTTIILLSNGYEIEAYDIIINDIARMVIPELRDQELALEEDVMISAMNDDYDNAVQQFQKLKKENPNSDFYNLRWNINSIGNKYTWNDQPEKALAIFQLNVDANPNWWASNASLGECYDALQDTTNAIAYYKKSITVNKTNESNYNEYLTKRIGELSK